jgi:hypothetical protein
MTLNGIQNKIVDLEKLYEILQFIIFLFQIIFF